MSIALKLAKVPPSKVATHSSVNLHMGEALCRVASDYPTVLDIILEQAQNAIDANARSISIVLNKKSRHIAIRDDGDGVSVETFERALQQVCLSGKESGKLGRFGIGLISPLDKCHSSTFTSCPRGKSGEYHEWTFVTEEIRQQAKNVLVPNRERPDLVFVKSKQNTAPKSKTGVTWRTEVNITRYTSDKMISRIGTIDSLSDAILERFSSVMRRNNIELNLKFISEDGGTEVREGVRARQFTGRPIKEVILTDGDGKIHFRLYLTKKTTKGLLGKVHVGEIDNDYRFGFNLFARSAEGLLPDEVVNALNSGIFEGEILGTSVKLHSTRKSFEKDDAFVGFCTAIETWHKEYGSQYLDREKEHNRDVRYQELGMQSLREIETMLQAPEFSEIRSILSGFRLGSVGPGHTPRSKDVLAGVQKERSLSIHGTHEFKAVERSDESSRDESSSDKPLHQPFTVTGPRGQQRTLVKRDSVGLQLSHIAMDGSDRLWELDTRQGILHFNVNHPIWVACDVSDRKVRQLQETVAIYALMLEAMPDELKESMRYAYDETLRPLTFLFHSSPAFNLRKRSS